MTNDSDVEEFKGQDAAQKWAWPLCVKTRLLPVRTRSHLWEGLYRMDGFVYTDTKNPKPFGRWGLGLNVRYREEAGPGLAPRRVADLPALVDRYERFAAWRADKRRESATLATTILTMLEERELTRCVVPTKRALSGFMEISITRSPCNGQRGLSRSSLSESAVNKLSGVEQLALCDTTFAEVGNSYIEACRRGHIAAACARQVVGWLELLAIRQLPRIKDNGPYGYLGPGRIARVDIKDWTFLFRSKQHREENSHVHYETGWRLHTMVHNDELDKVYTHLEFPGENNNQQEKK